MKTKVTPPKPVPPVPAEAVARPATTPFRNPRGKNSWSLPKVLGSPADVAEAVASAAFVPESAKALLGEAIRVNHGQGKLIRLDAHCNAFVQGDRAHTVINLHIAEL